MLQLIMNNQLPMSTKALFEVDQIRESVIMDIEMELDRVTGVPFSTTSQ